VFTSQPPAEYGGRAGGVINVVTKSGTNVFSGEGYEFLPQQGHEQGRQVHGSGGQGGPGSRSVQTGISSAPRSAVRSVMNRVHFFVATEFTQGRHQLLLVNTGRPQFYGKVRRGVRRRPSEQGFFVPGSDAHLTSEAEGICPLGVAEGGFDSGRAAVVRSANAEHD
jgi:hypothetical protein